MSDAPTQRFDAQPPAPSGQDRSKSRLPLILGIIGGILLIIVVILLFLLLRGNQGTPQAVDTTTPSPTQSAPPVSASPSATPTPTSSASHTTAPPPPPQGTSIQYFLIDNSTQPVIYCNTQSPNPTTINITFKWSTFKVSGVYLGVDTADATQGALFSNLPSSGTQADFPAGYNPYSYPCPAKSEEFTLTVVGSNGTSKVSRMVTVTNKGDTHN